jgi:hypothetical protein
VADISVRLFVSPERLCDGASSNPRLFCSLRMASILLIFQSCEDQQKKHFRYFSVRGRPTTFSSLYHKRPNGSPQSLNRSRVDTNFKLLKYCPRAEPSVENRETLADRLDYNIYKEAIYE